MIANMKKIILFLIISCIHFLVQAQEDKVIFAYGGEMTEAFVRYTMELTQKKNPKICFLPTALGDSPYYINYWYDITADLEMRPRVLRTWTSSSSQKQSFEEILLDMDAIIIGGGNAVNMLSIWRGQGIDTALQKAYEKGIVLAGGSAGSLCWFNNGLTDSRPVELTLVEGLGLLDFSNNVHHGNGDGSREKLYQNMILSKTLNDGYAFGEKSGVVFVNGKAKLSVSSDKDSFSYYVYENNGVVMEDKLEPILIE
jgi:peptidase E